MANIILPAVPVLSEINDNTKLLIEQAGEINRYPISDLDIGGGDVTINLSSSDSVDNIGNPINADTLGGYLAEDYVKHGEIRAIARNLLDNSYFRNPVNQRGFTSGSVATNAYFIDRWKAWATTTISAIDINGMHITSGTIRQDLTAELTSVLVGKTVTFVAKIDDAIEVCSVAVTNPGAFTELAINGHLEIAVTSTGTLICAIQSTAAITIEWAALYEGEYTLETLPEYQPKGYGVELAECLRYFYRFPKSVRFFSTKNAGIYGINVFYPTMMRIMPTISWENNVGAITIDHRTNIGFSAYYTGTEEAINDLTVSADL